MQTIRCVSDRLGKCLPANEDPWNGVPTETRSATGSEVFGSNVDSPRRSWPIDAACIGTRSQTLSATPATGSRRSLTPQLSTVYRLAKALRVPPVYLLPDADSQVHRKSPEQATTAAMSRVEEQLERLLADLPK